MRNGKEFLIVPRRNYWPGISDRHLLAADFGPPTSRSPRAASEDRRLTQRICVTRLLRNRPLFDLADVTLRPPAENSSVCRCIL